MLHARKSETYTQWMVDIQKAGSIASHVALRTYTT
jgi:hypothetical protein